MKQYSALQLIRRIMLMMLVAVALTGLSSCDDDEDEPVVKPEQRTLFID